MAKLYLSVFLFVFLLKKYCFANNIQLPNYPHEFKTLTWNMQGAGNSDLSKWFLLKSELARSASNPYQVVALQECGGLPEVQIVKRKVKFGNGVEVEYIPQSDMIDDSGPALNSIITQEFYRKYRPWEKYMPVVREFTYLTGTDSGRGRLQYYGYHLLASDKKSEVDPNERTNLAILSLQRADEVITVHDKDAPRRPILGIRIGNNMFFCVHAPAYSSNQIRKGLTAVADFIDDNPNNHFLQGNNYNWMFMGDFNREDVGSVFPSGQTTYTQRVIKPSIKTHQNGKILDYAILASSVPIGEDVMRAEVISKLFSDHWAVSFTPNPNARRNRG